MALSQPAKYHLVDSHILCTMVLEETTGDFYKLTLDLDFYTYTDHAGGDFSTLLLHGLRRAIVTGVVSMISSEILGKWRRTSKRHPRSGCRDASAPTAII
jgi:hypothetical protein